MKWTVKVEPENEHDEQALRHVNETLQKHSISGCIIALANNLKGESAAKYTDEIVASVVAAYVAAYFKAASDKR